MMAKTPDKKVHLQKHFTFIKPRKHFVSTNIEVHFGQMLYNDVCPYLYIERCTLQIFETIYRTR